MGNCPEGRLFSYCSLHLFFIHQPWKIQIPYQKHRLHFELYAFSEVLTVTEVHFMVCHSRHCTTTQSQPGFIIWTSSTQVQGQFHPVREDENNMWVTRTLRKLSYHPPYQWKTHWSRSHALVIEIFCQRQQFPKAMEQGKMNLSSYENGANNSWLVFNPVKIPAVLPKENRAIQVGKF